MKIKLLMNQLEKKIVLYVQVYTTWLKYIFIQYEIDFVQLPWFQVTDC